MARSPSGKPKHQPHGKRWQPDEKPQPGHRRHMDMKFLERIPARKKRLYQFTVIDDCTRIRVLKIYDACNQSTAIDFVDEVIRRLPFRVLVAQTDNGAEFQSKFRWPLEELDIRHVHIRPHTPRLNGKVVSTTKSSTNCSTRTASARTPPVQQEAARVGELLQPPSSARRTRWKDALRTLSRAREGESVTRVSLAYTLAGVRTRTSAGQLAVHFDDRPARATAVLVLEPRPCRTRGGALSYATGRAHHRTSERRGFDRAAAHQCTLEPALQRSLIDGSFYAVARCHDSARRHVMHEAAAHRDRIQPRTGFDHAATARLSALLAAQ